MSARLIVPGAIAATAALAAGAALIRLARRLSKTTTSTGGTHA